MRVLHVIPAIAPRYGGPSQAVVGMVRALRALGAEATIATTDADGPGRLSVHLGRQVAHRGVPCRFFPRGPLGLHLSRPLGCWLEGAVSDYDVVHTHAVFSHAPFAAARACRRSGVPYVVRPLGSLDPWSLRQKPWRKRLVWRLGVRGMLRHASAVHYTSDDERRRAEGPLGLERGVVVPVGVDAAELRALAARAASPPWLPEGPYVLALGRLHPKKRLALLAEAFLDATRADALRAWRLVLAGSGEGAYAGRLERLAAGAAGRVLLPGWLEGAEKAGALAGAALLAMPSAQENFGIAAAEALALGVPVLLSPEVDLAAPVREAGGGWVAAGERAALGAALVEALEDEPERRRRGAAGRALVEERFEWARVARALLTLYERLVSEGTP